MKQIQEIFSFYYSLLGSRIYLLVVLSLLAALVEVIGVGFLLPVLSGVDNDNYINNFFGYVFEFFGINYDISNILVVFVVLMVIRSILLGLEIVYRSKIMFNLLMKMRQKLFRKIFLLNYREYLNKSSGFLNNAIITELQNVVFAFKMLASLVVLGFFAIGYIVLPLLVNRDIVVISAGIMVAVYPLVRYINIRTKNYSLLTSKFSASLQAFLIQSFNNFKYLKSTGEYKRIQSHVNEQSDRLSHYQFRQSILNAITMYAFEPVIAIIIAAMIYYFVILNGNDIAEYVVVLYMLMTALRKLFGMQQNYRKFLSSWGSINVIKELEINLDQNAEYNRNDVKLPNNLFENTITFDNVSFSYDNNITVLNHIDLEITSNSTIALVGDSGCGKSTLINMLTGLLCPDDGAVMIDHVSLDDFNKDKFRSHIGYVTQESVIFNDTIRNNVSLWEVPDDNQDERIQNVLNKALLSDFVSAQPEGLNTVLGESGITISGGQRQRICIARELYKNPKIMIFDEATSALDGKTENYVRENIESYKGKLTIIIVSHRVSTIRTADRIYVLKDGTIVENGSYEQLISNNGEFKKIINFQHDK